MDEEQTSKPESEWSHIEQSSCPVSYAGKSWWWIRLLQACSDFSGEL